MKILNFVIISAKKYQQSLDIRDAVIDELRHKIGALEHDKKRLGDICRRIGEIFGGVNEDNKRTHQRFERSLCDR